MWLGERPDTFKAAEELAVAADAEALRLAAEVQRLRAALAATGTGTEPVETAVESPRGAGEDGGVTA
jgi:hypothetical protein